MLTINESSSMKTSPISPCPNSYHSIDICIHFVVIYLQASMAYEWRRCSIWQVQLKGQKQNILEFILMKTQKNMTLNVIIKSITLPKRNMITSKNRSMESQLFQKLKQNLQNCKMMVCWQKIKT